MTDLYIAVMTAAADVCSVPVEKVLTRVHKHEVTTARYIGWYVLNTKHGWSHSRIQRSAPMFHRVTIRHGVNRIAETPYNSEIGDLVSRTIDTVGFV